MAFHLLKRVYALLLAYFDQNHVDCQNGSCTKVTGRKLISCFYLRLSESSNSLSRLGPVLPSMVSKEFCADPLRSQQATYIRTVQL